MENVSDVPAGSLAPADLEGVGGAGGEGQVGRGRGRREGAATPISSKHAFTHSIFCLDTIPTQKYTVKSIQ